VETVLQYEQGGRGIIIEKNEIILFPSPSAESITAFPKAPQDLAQVPPSDFSQALQ
jgi:hypothetical protein